MRSNFSIDQACISIAHVWITSSVTDSLKKNLVVPIFHFQIENVFFHGCTHNMVSSVSCWCVVCIKICAVNFLSTVSVCHSVQFRDSVAFNHLEKACNAGPGFPNAAFEVKIILDSSYICAASSQNPRQERNHCAGCLWPNPHSFFNLPWKLKYVHDCSRNSVLSLWLSSTLRTLPDSPLHFWYSQPPDSLHQTLHCWFPCLFCFQSIYMEWPAPSCPTETCSGLIQI